MKNNKSATRRKRANFAEVYDRFIAEARARLDEEVRRDDARRAALEKFRAQQARG